MLNRLSHLFGTVPSLVLVAGSTAWLASAPLSAQTYTFQQNDSGQTVTNADGSQFTYPDNNFWTQPYSTGESVEGNFYTNALTNWTALTSYPNGPGVSAIINGSCHLNENVSFQSVTVGSAGSLAIDSGNSGGAGNHSIAVTMAAGGAGAVQNAGAITIGAAQLNTTITLANNLTLSGGGAYNFTNPTNLIQGPGTLILSPEVTLIGTAGADISAPIANAGLIESTESGGLTLNPATVTNTGTLAAIGGGALSLAASTLDNTNGTITVGDVNSVVLIENGTQVTGGTLQSTVQAPVGNSYGVIRLQGGASLANLTIAANAGVYVVDAGTLAGTVTNDGYLYVYGGSFHGNLSLAGNVTLAGSGSLYLGGNLEGANSATLTVGPGQTVELDGEANTSAVPDTIDANLVNNGTLTSPYVAALIDSPTFTNNGSVNASNGSSLYLSGSTLNNTGGVITAGASSLVILNGVTITGGTLSSVNDTGSDFDNGGYFRVDSPVTLNNVTLATGSACNVANPITVAGTLTNNGYFSLAGYNFNTRLTGGFTLSADATLAGTGTARLAGGEIDATNSATLTVAASATIAGGSGTINASVINNGTVESVYQALTINSPTFTNNGLLTATNGGSVSVSSGTNFSNYHAGTQTLTGGTYTVTDTGNGGTLDFSGRNVLVNAATIVLSGADPTFNALNGLTTNEGSFSLLALEQFTTSAALTNAGAITLDAGTTLHVGGTFTSGVSSALAITLGGTQSAGALSPGVLQVGGAATVGGTLALTFATGAALPANGDTLIILAAGSPVQGSFGNVPSGARLATTDGKGSFRVSYGATVNTVTLRDFLLPGQMDALPTATLSAVVPSVVAGSGQEGEFMLTLSSAPSADVVVNFTIKGSALNGTDYVLLKASKKIKAGKTSKPIYVIPQGDLGGVDKKTVVLTLAPGDGYQVGTTAKVKVKITD